jgi:hypothetical protein
MDKPTISISPETLIITPILHRHNFYFWNKKFREGKLRPVLSVALFVSCVVRMLAPRLIIISHLNVDLELIIINILSQFIILKGNDVFVTVQSLCISNVCIKQSDYFVMNTQQIWQRFCNRPTRSRFPVVFLRPRANAELVPKLHVALRASHAALPMVTLKLSPYTNVTLTFDFDFGLDHPVYGGYGWGSPTPRRKKVTVKQRN